MKKYTGSHFKIVENTPEGQAELKEIRALAKRNGWKVMPRGRGDRLAAARQYVADEKLHDGYLQSVHENFRQSLPLKYSQRFAVYVQYYDKRVHSWAINVTPKHFAKLQAKGKVK